MRAIRSIHVLFALGFFVATAAAATDASQTTDALITCLRAAAPLVMLPGDPAFGTARLVFNRDHLRTPLAIVEVESAAHIQAVIACGRDAKRRVVARGGGHGFEGAAIGDDVIVVDLKRMKNIEISADKTTASVDGGATLGDLYHGVWTRSQQGVLGGTCPGVGISGFLLGGGYSYWARKFGVACDRVASFDMVTAKGDLLTGITATGPHADLFWASCGGGGGNFGIVTEWTVRLFAPPPVVHFVTLQFSSDKAAALFGLVQRWGHTAPSDVGIKVQYGSEDPLRLIMYSLGADLKKVLAGAKVTALGPTKTTFKRFSFIEAVVEAAPRGVRKVEDLIAFDWRADGEHRKEKSFYLAAPLPTAVVRRLTALLGEQPTALGLYHPYGGAIASKANNATAFAHRRGVIGLLQVQVQWPGDAAGRKSALDWMNKVEALVGKYQVGAYVNYMDYGVKAWQKGYYGQNYARLQAVKQAYDPSMFFAFPGQAIRPTKEGACVFKPCV